MGQVSISGLVRDAATQQPLAAAHIIAEGQTRGTITNNAGQFDLELPALPAILLIRHVGYETVQLNIGPNDLRNVTVDLTEVVYQMEEVIVATDEFATSLMSKVIRTKQRRRAHLSTWQSRGYSRITLERDTEVVLVSEHVFDAYRDAVLGAREVVRSRRETASFYQTLGLDPIPVDFSEDYVAIQGQQFIGVTHPDALQHYHFSFAGNRTYQGHVLYDLYVSPKTSLHATFVGMISVLDSAYSLVTVDLRPARHVEYRPEVKRWHVEYQQHFAPVDSFWLPEGLMAQGSIRVDPDEAGIGPAAYRMVAVLQEHAANNTLPSAPYATQEQTTDDEASVFKDDLFLLGDNIIALMPAESHALDRLRRQGLTLRDALPSTDPAAKPRAITYSTPDGEQPQFVWPVIWGVEPWLRFNRVEGYFIGGGIATDWGRTSTGARLAKGTGDNGTRFAVRLSRQLSRQISTTLSGGRDTSSQQGSRIYTMALNSLTSRLGYADYFDYYWRWWGRASAHYARSNIRLGVAARLESHFDADRTFKRAWPFSGSFRANPSVATGQWVFLEATAAAGNHWQPFRMGPTQRAEVRIQHGFGPEAASYGRAELYLDTSAKTLLQKRPRPMLLSVRVIGAASWGSLPPQGTFPLEGAIGPVATLGVLRSLRTSRYLGRHAAGLYWEHDFRTVLWEALGLRFLVNRRTGITIGGAHARVWPSNSTVHHELTASLTEVLGTPVRVDLTRRLDRPGWFVSVGLSRMF